jgi:adenine-specific DNA-methyltransferase
MPIPNPEPLQEALLALLPEDHSFVGNAALQQQLTQALGQPVADEAFRDAREALVTRGHAIKGKGRGGSTARATGAARPDFSLQAEVVTPDMLAPTPAPALRKPKAAPTPATSGEPQVLSYRHPDRRVNNPEVGLVNEASDPEQPKTAWAYDPHLDPALQFDSARA